MRNKGEAKLSHGGGGSFNLPRRGLLESAVAARRSTIHRAAACHGPMEAVSATQAQLPLSWRKPIDYSPDTESLC